MHSVISVNVFFFRLSFGSTESFLFQRIEKTSSTRKNVRLLLSSSCLKERNSACVSGLCEICRSAPVIDRVDVFKGAKGSPWLCHEGAIMAVGQQEIRFSRPHHFNLGRAKSGLSLRSGITTGFFARLSMASAIARCS
jgi:hypothetical protein